MTIKLTGKRCQCADGAYGGCGEYFTTASNFDRHRVGPYNDRWCLSEFGMEAIGLVPRMVGEERLWGGPPRPILASAEARKTA